MTQMVTILEIEVDGATVLVESEISETGKKVVAAKRQKGGKKFHEIIDVIKPISKSIIDTIDQMPRKPDSATAEFGLKFSVEGGVILAKASDEASLTVSLTWNRP